MTVKTFHETTAARCTRNRHISDQAGPINADARIQYCGNDLLFVFALPHIPVGPPTHNLTWRTTWRSTGASSPPAPAIAIALPRAHRAVHPAGVDPFTPNLTPYFVPPSHLTIRGSRRRRAKQLREDPEPHARRARTMPGTHYASAAGAAAGAATGAGSSHHHHHHHHHTSGAGRSPGRSSTPIAKKTTRSTRSHRSHRRCRTCHRSDGTHSRSCSHSHHHHHHSRHSGGGGGGGIRGGGAAVTMGNSAKAAASSAPSLVILVLLGVAACVFIGVGIWLLATRFGWPVALDFVGSKDWTRFLSIGLLIFLAGLFMLVIVVLAFGIRASGSRVCRTALVFLLAVAFSLLLLVSLLCIIFGAQGVGWTTNWLRDGWEKTARTTPSRLCDFQRENSCYGFEDNDCAGCDVTTDGAYTASCSETQRRLCPACVSGSAADGNGGNFGLLRPLNPLPLISQDPSHAFLRSHQTRERTVAFVATDGAPLIRLAARTTAVGDARQASNDADSLPTPEAADGGSSSGAAAGGAAAGAAAAGGSDPGSAGAGGAEGGGIVASNGAGLFTEFAGNGCKDALKTDFRQFMIPFAVAALFTLLLVFLLFFFFCCAVGK